MKNEFVRLFERDIQRLYQEIDAYQSDEALWQVVNGISNSAGNLGMHLVGNLNEYIGRLLGQIPYQRDRPYEFSATGLAKEELLDRIKATKEVVVRVLNSLEDETLHDPFPENILGYSMTVLYFLIHLQGHLNYHVGQIDYHRRILTGAGPIRFVS